MPPSTTWEHNTKTAEKYKWKFCTFFRSIVSTKFNTVPDWNLSPIRVSRDGPLLVSTECSSNSQHASRLFPLGQASLLAAPSIVARRTLSTYLSRFSKVELWRLIMPNAAEESQHRICSSALHPNFNTQFHCCRKPMPSQIPENAATNSASPLLSPIVDCFLLDAVIEKQASLLCTHDAVPLTLNRSASPPNLSPHTPTLSCQELFSKASRLSVVRTAEIPAEASED